MARLFDILSRPFCRFARAESGVSAVEFAVLLPLMLTLYLGGVETTQVVSADRKVTLVAHTIADLAAQKDNVNSTIMQNILSAGVAVASPYNPANLQVVVSSVLIDTSGRATVDWSAASTGASQRSGTVTSLIPPPLVAACTAAATTW